MVFVKDAAVSIAENKAESITQSTIATAYIMFGSKKYHSIVLIVQCKSREKYNTLIIEYYKTGSIILLLRK